MQIISQSLSASSSDVQRSIANMKQSTQQILPQLSDLMNELTQSSVYLRELLRELKNNPSVLIRGTKPAAKGPGE
jgi:DNA-binding FadR family transcriptional regulator